VASLKTHALESHAPVARQHTPGTVEGARPSQKRRSQGFAVNPLPRRFMYIQAFPGVFSD